jgi:anthranilate phosphoribosyltransferase
MKEKNKYIPRLIEGHRLSREESYACMMQIGKGEWTDIHIASLLTLYRYRNIEVEELIGFRDALLDLSIDLGIDTDQTIDLCGTGGDGKNTINISTLASIVVASCGGKVLKHGNYGVSSFCGSSNVLEAVGYQFENNPSKIKQQLEETNISFLHAPLFHPAMKHVATVRRALGFKTIFNLLGPLANPSRPSHQLVGVSSLSILRKYKHVLSQGKKKYAVVYSMDGYDEISLTNKAKCVTNQTDQVLSARDFGTREISADDILGGRTVKEAAELFIKVIQGEGTSAQNRVVCANAAIALKQLKKEESLQDLYQQAMESLLSKTALKTFKKLIK